MVSRIKQNLLILAIAVVLFFFVYYGISTFYGEPEYGDYCNQSIYNFRIGTPEQCDGYGGKWFEPQDLGIYSVSEEYLCTKIPGGNETNMTLNCRPYGQKGYCDVSYYCSREFSEAMEIYNRNIFIIAVVLGVALIYLGGGILRLESVSSGVMGGGVLTIFYGVVKYWGFATDAVRFLALGIALFVLIWLGYRRLNPDRRKKKGFDFLK
ncbi:MAG: hypothetical protein ACP5E4_02620 [Candidatus Aenigmatarchaeota archaeon]